MEATTKDANRQLVQRGNWNADERRQILDYCQADVDGTAGLFHAMEPKIDLPRALIRGRFMSELTHMEARGIPMDGQSYVSLHDRWEGLKHLIVSGLDHAGLFEGLTLRHERWLAYVTGLKIPWPLTVTGRPRLDEETIRTWSLQYPKLRPYANLSRLLSKFRQLRIPIGTDGRARCAGGAFGTRTGRCAPDAAAFVFNYPKWLRGLVRPEPGRALAYVDFVAEEFGVAGALSKDRNMLKAYERDDIYLAFAEQAGAVPPSATKRSHPEARSLYKAVVLGTGYGMGPNSLSTRIGVSVNEASDLLRQYRRTYPDFQRWVDRQICSASVNGRLESRMGWQELIPPGGKKITELRNWAIQADSGDILRLATIGLGQSGVKTLATVHDAVLIEDDERRIEDAVEVTQRTMSDASAVILDGFKLKTEAKIMRHGERLLDPEFRPVWDAAMHAG